MTPSSFQSSSWSSSSPWAPTVPAPIKSVFDRFPLVVYPANALPARCSSDDENENVLYLFTDAHGARRGAPSFNPQCLKWQAYLKFSGVPFRTLPSTNHASPSGSLPFLLPAADALAPVPASKLRTWVSSQSSSLSPSSPEQQQPQQQPTDQTETEQDSRHEPYMSLLDHRIRRAWLYAVYIHEANSTSVARRLYVDPCTTNPLVRLALAQRLQHAALDELLRHSSGGADGFIDVDDILSEADRAFEALSTLLGDDAYFFGGETPGLFDASVFAYTHLALEEEKNEVGEAGQQDDVMGWRENVLGRYVRRHANLVGHRERIRREYFSASSPSQ